MTHSLALGLFLHQCYIIHLRYRAIACFYRKDSLVFSCISVYGSLKVRWHQQGPRRRIRPLSTIFAFWIFMDLVQSLSYSLTFRWAVLGKVIAPGTYCTAQGEFDESIPILIDHNIYRSLATDWGRWYCHFSVPGGAFGCRSISSSRVDHAQSKNCLIQLT